MTWEHFGHQYITADGQVFEKGYEGPYVVGYHHVELDHAYIRRGVPPRIDITVSRDVTVGQLKGVLPNVTNSKVRGQLEKMIETGDIEHSVEIDNSPPPLTAAEARRLYDGKF
jgi:hypothetical protein